MHFAVLDFFRDDTQCERLDLERGFFRGCPVDRDTGRLGDVANPAAVRLAEQPDGELHTAMVTGLVLADPRIRDPSPLRPIHVKPPAARNQGTDESTETADQNREESGGVTSKCLD